MSQAIPGGAQSPTGGHSRAPMLQIARAKPQEACPKSYYECATVAPKKPFKQELCVVYPSTSGCSYPYPGIWTWSAPITKVKKGGHPKGRVAARFAPNPGNPTELTIVLVGMLNPSDGKVVRVAHLEFCNSYNSCQGPLPIGIIIGK
jgi:hypothetical protein